MVDPAIEAAVDALWESIDNKGIQGRLFREDCGYVARAVVTAAVPLLLAPLRDLHQPEKRWQPHADADYSYDTEEGCRAEAEANGWGEVEPTFFTICAECGRIERSDADRQDHGEFSGYDEALWPCRTVRVLDESESKGS